MFGIFGLVGVLVEVDGVVDLNVFRGVTLMCLVFVFLVLCGGMLVNMMLLFLLIVLKIFVLIVLLQVRVNMRI